MRLPIRALVVPEQIVSDMTVMYFYLLLAVTLVRIESPKVQTDVACESVIFEQTPVPKLVEIISGAEKYKNTRLYTAQHL